MKKQIEPDYLRPQRENEEEIARDGRSIATMCTVKNIHNRVPKYVKTISETLDSFACFLRRLSILCIYSILWCTISTLFVDW